MNNSASRFESQYPTFVTDSSAVSLCLADRISDPGTIESVLRFPVEPQPLLMLQRLALQETPVICICDDFRAAQRYFCEAVNSEAVGPMQPFLIHEMMPAHHQDYVLDNIAATCDQGQPASFVLVTTSQFYPQICSRHDWLSDQAEVINTGHNLLQNPSNQMSGTEPTVSCICLRTGSAGRWVLMDHDDAATVHSGQAPSDELAGRLLRHTVNISGNRLAPYLAMMFDVPHAWKSHPELATRSLLIFSSEVCNLGCYQPGIPQKIIWNDLLGIIYDA